jgi:polyhydroxyalkanoate synthesis repressor PhaR
MVLIKRYPNRKLYNTEAKQYITLDGVAELIRQGDEVQVTDHTTGEDLTTLTLTQIILEQEKKQSGLLPHAALTSLIRAGEDRLSALQRGLIASIGSWPLVDEEIKRRIQLLVSQGELSDTEGKALLGKFLKQTARQREEHHSQEEGSQLSEEKLEDFLKKRQVPTRADIRRLNDQLEELAARIEQVSKSKAK